MEITGKRYGRSDWRKLLSTRRGTILVAVACTIIAGGVLAFAMARYRNSVSASANPETVFVASQLIPKNTPGDVVASEDMFKVAHITAKNVSAGAIADAAAIHGKVAVRDINPGEQLTAADFTPNGGIPAQLGPADRAMTLTLDAQHGMLGLIQTGDHVDVYAGISATNATGQATPQLRLLISNVPVLKAGTDNGGSSIAGANNNTSPVTLKVPDNAAGPLAFAADNGKVWLVLRPANATRTVPPSSTSVQSLLLSGKAVPYGGNK